MAQIVWWSETDRTNTVTSDANPFPVQIAPRTAGVDDPDKGPKNPPMVVTVTTTATQLLPTDLRRISAAMQNTSTTPVYLGNDAEVTTTNGFPLQSSVTATDADSNDAWWGIVASGTATVALIVTRRA